MDRKNRVLHVLWSGRAGGAERFVRDIFIHADAARFEHSVCFLSGGGSFAAAMEHEGATTYCLNMKNGLSVARGARLRALIKRTAPHIIQSNCRNYVANSIIARMARPKKIYVEHGSDLIARNRKRDVTFYSKFGRSYDLIMANSYYTRDMIRELTDVDMRNVTVFYIGIDPDAYRRPGHARSRKTFGFANRDTVIGTIGRLVEQKGIDDFILAAAELAKRRRSCRFVVVGAGPKRAELERMAHAHRVDVTFCGEQRDIPSIIKAFDLFLFTPKWEPFGIVVLEALAASVPVVGYSVPGMQEIVDRGGGVLIGTRDPRALAQTAADILTDRQRYRALQHAGRANVRAHFDIRKRVSELESVYVKLLARA